MLLRLWDNSSHLLRQLLTFLPKASTVDMGTSYTSSGHSVLCRVPCWYIYALNLPGRPDLSTALSQLSSSWRVDWSDDEPFRLLLDTLPRLFTGFSEVVLICT